MGEWAKDFQSHEALDLLSSVEEALDQGPSPSKEEEAEAYERLRFVVGQLRRRINALPDALRSGAMLDGFVAPLTQLQADLESATTNAEPDDIRVAANRTDALLRPLASLPVVVDQDVVDLVEARRTLDARARLVMKSLEEQVSSLREGSIASLDNKVARLEQRISEAEASLDGAKSEFDQQVTVQKQRLDTAINQHVDQFSTSQDERKEEFDSFLAEVRASAEEGRSRIARENQDAIETLNQSGNAVLEELKGMREQAVRLVDVIGRAGTSWGFQQYADQQKKAADSWRVVSVCCLGLVVAFALILLFTTDSSDFNLRRSTINLLFSGPLLAGAAYAARQSGAHRRAEGRNRQLELEIAALDPYLALLPNEDQIEIKKLMALRSFGRSSEHSADDSDLTPERLNALLNIVRRGPA
jgi:hypothetical protein